MSRLRAAAVTIGLFLVLLAVLVPGPTKPAIDTKWAIPTAMSLIRGNAGDISEYVGTSGLDATLTFGARRYNVYPLGAPLLSVPAVAVMNLVDPDFNEKTKNFATTAAEKVIAVIFGALTSVVFFWVIYSRFRDFSIALISTLVLMFCTSMWSTATRALWSHGPMVLAVTVAMLLLLRARSRPALAQYVSLPLAMAFVARPSAAVPIVTFSLYVSLVHRAYFIKYMVWSTVIAVPWIGFNLWSFGAPFPEYYLLMRVEESLPLWQALAVQLVSPGRGLFVFSPVLLFAFSGLVLALMARDDRGLHLAFAATIVLHLLLISQWQGWWAGWSFGPQFMTDVLPFLVYFFAFNIRSIVPIDNRGKAAMAAVIGLFAAASVLIHAQGAYRGAPDRWNSLPFNIDQDPARIWDWTDLQFTRGVPFINPEPRATARPATAR